MGLDNLGDMHYTDSDGYCCIHHAIKNNHTQLVKMILTHDRELIYFQVEDTQRDSALHLIAACGNVSMMKVVSDYDPDFSVQNLLGDTPLHVASRSGDQKMTMLLINLCQSRLIFEAVNKAGKTAIDVCSDLRLKSEMKATI